MVDRLVRFFLELEFGGCERLIRANYSLAEQLEVMDMWVERPYLYVFPMIGAMAAILLAFSVRYRWDEVPFFVVTVIFLCAFGTLALSFWPYMIPFVLTIEEAAAPQSSLAFMFWGEGLFVLPLMLFYTAISYSVFRGKVRSAAGYYGNRKAAVTKLPYRPVGDSRH